MSVLTELNNEQKAVIQSHCNRIFINAGPGSGKTRTIIAKVVDLVKRKGVKPHKIWLCTFTNSAAETLKKRLRKELGKETAQKVKVNTIHGLALQYLCSNEIIAEDGFLTASEQEKIFEDLHLDTKAVRNLLKLEKAENRNNAPTVKQFYDVLEARELWSYDYCINKMIDILRQDHKELGKIRNSFDFLIVDEYQDCNGNQVSLLKTLVGKDKNILLVGDPDQMIYDWRGAKDYYSNNILRHFSGLSILNLVYNYRSGTKIVESANSLIKLDVKRLPKILKAVNTFDGTIKSAVYRDSSMQAWEIAKKVDESLTKSIAILCTTHSQCRKIANAFDSRGVAYHYVSSDEEKSIPKKTPLIMTVFAAKGMEFDTVFVPYAFESCYKNKLRLFYVAVTRAKRALYLSTYTSQVGEKVVLKSINPTPYINRLKCD